MALCKLYKLLDASTTAGTGEYRLGPDRRDALCREEMLQAHNGPGGMVSQSVNSSSMKTYLAESGAEEMRRSSQFVLHQMEGKMMQSLLPSELHLATGNTGKRPGNPGIRKA